MANTRSDSRDIQSKLAAQAQPSLDALKKLTKEGKSKSIRKQAERELKPYEGQTPRPKSPPAATSLPKEVLERLQSVIEEDEN